MHFVSGDGGIEFVLGVALAHPLGIAPLVAQIPHDGRRPRRNFIEVAVRVGLIDRVHVVARAYVVLVDRAMAEVGEKGFPHARTLARIHGMRVRVPAVEVADHRDAFRVGCPHSEVGAAPAVLLHYMRAELLVEARVFALVEQMQIEWGQQSGILLLGRRWCHQLVLLMAWMTVRVLTTWGTYLV